MDIKMDPSTFLTSTECWTHINLKKNINTFVNRVQFFKNKTIVSCIMILGILTFFFT